GCGIVGQPVVLTRTIGEFRLQKKIVALDQSGATRGGQSLADSLFEVMPSLVGRVDAPKTHAQREFGEGRRAIFLPGSAVKKIGDGRVLHRITHAITGVLLSPLLPKMRR